MDTDATPNADPPKSRRRWYQFGLRSLLLFALLAVAAGAVLWSIAIRPILFMGVVGAHPVRTTIALVTGAVLIGLILKYRRVLARLDPEEPNDLPSTAGALIAAVIGFFGAMAFGP